MSACLCLGVCGLWVLNGAAVSSFRFPQYRQCSVPRASSAHNAESPIRKTLCCIRIRWRSGSPPEAQQDTSRAYML